MLEWIMIVTIGYGAGAYAISEPMPTEAACKTAIERITDEYSEVSRWSNESGINLNRTKCIKITK